MAVIRNPLIRLSLGAVLAFAPGVAVAQAPTSAASTPPQQVAPAAESPNPTSTGRPEQGGVKPAPATSAPSSGAAPSPSGAGPSEVPTGAAPAVSAGGPAQPAPAAVEEAPRPGEAAKSATEPPPWSDDLSSEAASEEPESMGWMLVRTLFVLGAVVASIYLTLNVGLRRLMGLQGATPGRQTVVSVVERLTLDPKRSLFVVKAADEYLLVGGGESGLQLLSKLDTEAVERIRAQASPPPVVPLSPFLQKLLSRRSGGSSSQPPGA
ncbi:flagellar biosynthetic protein FliO [Myxococcus sp. K15C18031901]|uniref:FliO/MopB family protein n=1 Tax=Myxococcus dinghuensis TaxID=2906761 RepID=UPI0020A6E5CF|nr:flagellar biosynthetic protein FliO [Myxococcus dinghuensis]MCP3097620.1 flagellar biosynthetic protein FliO [Myxococcus dinghuensis]